MPDDRSIPRNSDAVKNLTSQRRGEAQDLLPALPYLSQCTCEPTAQVQATL